MNKEQASDMFKDRVISLSDNLKVIHQIVDLVIYQIIDSIQYGVISNLPSGKEKHGKKIEK